MSDETYDAKHGGRGARPGGSSSATTRKNKLQRCSVCGGLGHKSRTCELAAYKLDAGAEALSRLTEAPDADQDPADFDAAYGLLNLAAAAAPPPAAAPAASSSQPAAARQLMAVETGSPQRMRVMAHSMEPHGMAQWQPLSPRLLAN